MAPKSNFSKEEELLLQDFGRGLSAKSSAIFYFHAFIVSAVPLYLFSSIQQMYICENAILFGIGTLVSIYFISFAYKNNKFELKHKIAQMRGDGVSAEIHAAVADMDGNKKVSKKEKDERILWRKNEVAEAESIQLAVFNTNLTFLCLLILLAFLIFKNYAPIPNYAISVFVASGLTALFSTSSQN